MDRYGDHIEIKRTRGNIKFLYELLSNYSEGKVILVKNELDKIVDVKILDEPTVISEVIKL